MFLFLFSTSIVTLAIYHFYWKRRNLPPGPTPIPILGNALALGNKKPPYDVFKKWQNKYGSIYTYWLGGTPIVAVNEFNLIRETFIKDGETYTGRNVFEEMLKLMRDGRIAGVVATDGDLWRDQRRFTLHVLRNFGMGRTLIEDIIMVEVDRLLTKTQEGIEVGDKAQQLAHVVELCVGSIINQILFGYRFVGETEEEFYRLKRMLNDNTKLLGNPLVQFMMLTSPKLLKNFPYFDKIFHAAIKNSNNVTEFLDHQIAEHRKRFSVEGEPEEATNYVQAFLMEMNKREKNGDVGNFTIKQLLDMCNDLWNAGQETTATTTNFGILYIMTHPVTQQKIQAEIDRVVGSERKVSLNDRPNLPYTNAVCNETQRLCNLLPQNLLHRTTKDIFINGYKIKKGTSIVPQISCVLFDQKTFPNPETFEPERFLDETGKLKRVDEFIPFSVGKRQCLGESLAKNELFLFLSNMYHEFKIRPSDPNQTLEKINGLAVQPPPFKCNVERRIPIIH